MGTGHAFPVPCRPLVDAGRDHELVADTASVSDTDHTRRGGGDERAGAATPLLGAPWTTLSWIAGDDHRRGGDAPWRSRFRSMLCCFAPAHALPAALQLALKPGAGPAAPAPAACSLDDGGEAPLHAGRASLSSATSASSSASSRSSYAGSARSSLSGGEAVNRRASDGAPAAASTAPSGCAPMARDGSTSSSCPPTVSLAAVVAAARAAAAAAPPPDDGAVIASATAVPPAAARARLAPPPASPLHAWPPPAPARDAFAPPLIGPKRPEDAHKKTLVLDLDETLVHSSFRPVGRARPDYLIPVDIDGRLVDIYVLKRPWVDHFLAVLGERFEVRRGAPGVPSATRSGRVPFPRGVRPPARPRLPVCHDSTL
jgi:hypothetical protein